MYIYFLSRNEVERMEDDVDPSGDKSRGREKRRGIQTWISRLEEGEICKSNYVEKTLGRRGKETQCVITKNISSQTNQNRNDTEE
jgi:hypothetical protein